MFHYCCGGYHGCPVFHRINMESVNDSQRGIRSATREFVTPSLRGAPIRRIASV